MAFYEMFISRSLSVGTPRGKGWRLADARLFGVVERDDHHLLLDDSEHGRGRGHQALGSHEGRQIHIYSKDPHQRIRAMTGIIISFPHSQIKTSPP